MKKILGISLCALFAVSAANAEIASTEWVEQQIGGIDTTLEGLGDLATKDAVTAAEITDGAVTSTKINDGAVTEAKLGASAVTTAKIANGAVTTTQIAGNTITDANIATGAGILSSKIAFDTDEEAALNSGITATLVGQIETAVQDVTTGSSNGTISVDGTDVAVAGLGSAAYKSIDDFATGEEGELAASALQQADVITGTTPGAISVKGTPVAVHGLGTAAYKSIDDFATGEEGELAASAVQAADVATGGANGTISVKGADVAVKGLGSAAYTESTAYAPAALTTTVSEHIARMNAGATQGQYVKYVKQENGKVIAEGESFADNVAEGGEIAPTSDAVVSYVADKAVQTLTTGTTKGTIKVDGTTEVAVAGLKELAYKDTVTSTEITDGTIMNADISDTAKIAMNKIDFSSEQTGAIDSGIDSVKVGQIATNTGNINTNKNSIEAIQDFLTDMVDEARGYTDCKSDGNGCTLVLDVNGFKWEKVTREVQ